jgi:hypothetical protein
MSVRRTQEPGQALLRGSPTGVFAVVEMFQRVLDEDALLRPAESVAERGEGGLIDSEYLA